MNRIKFLALLKKHGYNGGEDLTAVKDFLKDTDLVDDSNQPIDIDATWANVERKTLKFAATQETADTTKAIGNIDRMIAEKAAPNFTIKGFRREMAKKNYKAKAALGLTRFADPDIAELACSAFRFASAEAVGMKSYAARGDDEGILQKASAFTNTGGQALINPEYTNLLLYATEPVGVANRLAYVVNMTSDEQYNRRKTDILTIAHRSPTGAYAETANAYDMVKLNARDMGGICRLPMNLMDDNSISAVDDIAATVQEARDIRTDTDYILADGTATYGGNVGLNNGLVSGAYVAAASATWASQTEADLLLMVGSVQNCNFGRAKWLCSRQWFMQVPVRLGLAKSGVTAKEFQTGGSIESFKSGNPTILDFPVEFSELMPIAGGGAGEKVAFFGDFVAGTMLGNRNTLEVATSEHAYFTTGEVGVRIRVRGAVNICGDGRGSTFGPIRALKNS